MNPREKALAEFRKKLIEHKEVEARLKQSKNPTKKNSKFLKKKIFIFPVREDLRTLTKDYDKSENDLKALQSVGQVIAENARFSSSHRLSFDLDRWRSFKTIDRRQM